MLSQFIKSDYATSGPKLALRGHHSCESNAIKLRCHNSLSRQPKLTSTNTRMYEYVHEHGSLLSPFSRHCYWRFSGLKAFTLVYAFWRVLGLKKILPQRCLKFNTHLLLWFQVNRTYTHMHTTACIAKHFDQVCKKIFSSKNAHWSGKFKSSHLRQWVCVGTRKDPWKPVSAQVNFMHHFS